MRIHRQYPKTYLTAGRLLVIMIVMAMIIPVGKVSAHSFSDSPARPIITVQSYWISVDTLQPGMEFTLKMRLQNDGEAEASNLVVTFVPGELVPRQTGGVIAVASLAAGDKVTLSQPLSATWDIWGKSFASINVTVSYQGADGTKYTGEFTLTFPVYTPSVIITQTPTPTPTVTPTTVPAFRPQLVIESYATDVTLLQPGFQFVLTMQVHNVGNGTAKRITMIVGGGSANSYSGEGTPGPGGTSGGGGEFTNFAPLGRSNIQSLGDLKAGDSLSTQQDLIVNVTTNPGAYPMKISFAYISESGQNYVDDQVITLLVYSLPNIAIDFYQATQPFFTGQPGVLPLQIINLGRKSAVLGNLKVMAVGAELSNNIVLIGTLEPGGYFPLDATIIPMTAGPFELNITVDYTDDFNQQQQITKILTIEVMEAEMPPEGPVGPDFPGGEGGNGAEIPTAPPETFWQKVWRFILGLLGLDSGIQTPPPAEIPVEIVPEAPVYNGPRKGP